MVLIYVAMLAYGSYFIHSNFFLNVICKGDTTGKKIALTFDDGPHPEVTPAILTALNEFNVKATFFCIGKQVAAQPDIVTQMIAYGHTIGNHTYNHTNLFNFSRAGNMQKELDECSVIIEQTIGKRPHYFRPPYGVTNPNLAKAITHTGMATIGWSLRSMDTAIKDPNKLLKRVTSQLKPGAIVLFHDTQSGTVSVLREFLQYCRNNGYEVVPLPELIKIPAYE
jgi:peptidoglycan/xylan/chitin deacetylase (PgdA/CDA1 family)